MTRRIARSSWRSCGAPSNALIRGGAGLRKLRWGAEGRGKRGGVRTIYFWAVEDDVCFMLFMFARNEQGDLPQKQLEELARAVREEFS